MTVLDFGFVHPHRLVGGRGQRFTGAQAKPCAVTRADDLVAFDFATGQLRPIVSTYVLDGVKVLAVAHDGNHAAAHRHRLGLTVRQIMGKTRINPCHKKSLASLTSCLSAGAPRPTSWFDSRADRTPVRHWRAPPLESSAPCRARL